MARDIQHDALEIEDFDKRKAALKQAMACESCSRLESMVKLCQSEKGVCIDVNDLDKNTMLFNVQNGTINLVTGELQAHSAPDMISQISPVVYTKDAKSPIFLGFLNKTMREKREILEYIQKLNGYALSGEVMEKGFYVFHGITDTGKSTFLELILYIMGEYGASTETSLLLSNKFKAKSTNDLADLVGKRFVCASETEEGAALDEPRIKMLTSGLDSVRCRQLYERNFEYKPQFKIVLATNSKPYIRGSDDAIWNRLHCVPFDVQIPKNEQDKKLPQKMKKEAGGILNWMIEGCLKWQREGLNDPEEIHIHTQTYRDSMDTIKVFLDEYYVREKGTQHIIPNKEMYQKYRLSQISNGINELSIININTFITKVGNSGLFHKKINRAEHWFNIREKTTTEAASDEENRKQELKRYEEPDSYESYESESKVYSKNESLDKLDAGLIGLIQKRQPLSNLHAKPTQNANIEIEPEQPITGLSKFIPLSQQELGKIAMAHIAKWNPPELETLFYARKTLVAYLRPIDDHKHDNSYYDKICEDVFIARGWMAP